MASAFELYDRRGRLIMDGTGRYGRIIEVFNPFSFGVPSARDYPKVDPGSLNVMVTQGNRRVLTVQRVGTRVSWDYADDVDWPELTGSARIIVFMG
ncbi:hypothetical protein [Pseudomonas sp. RL]|uniref:hypothetical protein n=1 Tax=Pseudomonas sp. RL TaxID=1452718 RepID=UPI000481A172|nr:hypothetical protein [Pseudomonas sp. RL]